MYRFADLPSIAVGLAVSLTLTAMLPARSEDRTAGPTIPSPLPAEAFPALREKPTPSSDPPALERLRAKGLTVKGGGRIGRELRFWLLRSPEGREAFVATTAEGFLLRGKIYAEDGALLIDTEGHSPLSLSEGDRRAHGLSWLTGLPTTAETDLRWRIPHVQGGSKPPMSSGAVWDQLGRATAIEEGRAGAPLVYIFVDPYCSYCHRQWHRLREKVRRGTLRVRWVPVAVLAGSQSNLGVVGGLLADPTPETLAGWMRDRRVRPDESEAAQRALGLNRALFQALNVPSVPALIYKDRTGQPVTRVGVTDL